SKRPPPRSALFPYTTLFRSHDVGAVVLTGRASEETLAPYQPFLEALRHFFLNAPLRLLRSTAREYGPELARLVPELRRRPPDLRSEDHTPQLHPQSEHVTIT